MLRVPTIAAAVTLLALAAPAAGQLETQAFGGADFSYLKQGGISGGCETFATPCYIWTTGDYWAETFGSSSLGNVGALRLNLNIRNVMGSLETITFGAFVNATQVGSLTFLYTDPDGAYGFSYGFSPIAASDYRVELRVTSPSVRNGSVGLYMDGSSTATIEAAAVPEPLSVVLLASGLLAVGLVGWKRRNETEPV